MTDFYNVVANSRPICDQDTDIIIIDIAQTNRHDVVDILEIIGDHNPKAVGLDVTFNDPKYGDERLMEALDNCPNLVMAIGVEGELGARSEKFRPIDYSYFYNTAKSKYDHGVINFPSKFEGATIRQFQSTYPISNNEPIPSFALAVAKKAGSNAANELLKSDVTLKTIDFPSRRFDIIAWHELPDYEDVIDNKIVLIGAIGEAGDTHITPIDNHTSGVIIHALALSTILRNAYYSVIPKWITMAISFLLCFLLCFGNVTMKKIGARAMWMRFIQLAGLYIIIQIGYWLFAEHHIIVDFSYTLLMLLFGFFAIDIWFGVEYYADKVLNRIKENP